MVLPGMVWLVGAGAGVVMLRVPASYTFSVSGRWQWNRTWQDCSYEVPLLVVLPAALLTGFLSNLVGLGGGVLLVPLLTIVGGVPMQVAIGSSACMVGITALSGFFGHAVSGHIDLGAVLTLGVFVVIGSQIGARISTTVDKQKLRRIFVWTSICIGLLMLLRSIWG